MALPTDRSPSDPADDPAEHANDHNTLAALHNSFEGTTPASFEPSGAVTTHAGAADPHTGYLKESVISGLATPAIILGSSAAAGSTLTPIRSDATIAAFDVTAPSTQAFADAAAVGTAAFAARRDHKHAMMANPVTAHEAAADPHTGYLLESAHSGAWTAYTPTLTQSATVSKTVNYARYQRLGRWVTVMVMLTASSSGTAANAILLGLPVAAEGTITNLTTLGMMNFFDTSAGLRHTCTANLNNATTLSFLSTVSTANSLFGSGGAFSLAMATGDTISVKVSYEAAS